MDRMILMHGAEYAKSTGTSNATRYSEKVAIAGTPPSLIAVPSLERKGFDRPILKNLATQWDRVSDTHTVRQTKKKGSKCLET